MKDSLHVLIIDDNPDDRALALRELRREFPNFAPLEIVDDRDLAQALERGQFDLVVTDYHLQWTDGVVILHSVKERYPECPVIMVTGTGNEEIAALAMKAGLDDYIVKSPKHYARLRPAARSALEQAAQRRARREAEARYQALFDRVPVGLYVTTPDGRFLDANPTLVAMLRFPDKQTLSRAHTAELFINPDDRRIWQGRMDREGVVRDFEVELRCRDGTQLWVRDHARAVRDEKSGALHYEGVLQDITERKRAEQQLRLLAAAFQSADDAVTITDADSDPEGPHIVSVNDAFTRMTGYSQQDVAGKSPRILHGPLTDRNILARLRQELDSGRTFAGQTVHYRKDGTSYNVEWTAAPVRDRTGRITHYVSVQRDITERLKLEENLRQNQKLDAVGQLASGIAHDFNNLLTAIFGYTALAKRCARSNREALEAIERAEQAAQQASGITKSLLTFTHESVTEKRPVNLRAVLLEAARLLGRMLPASIELVVDGGDRDAHVFADPTQLQQIILNLAINARDAMPDGGRLRMAVTTFGEAARKDAGAGSKRRSSAAGANDGESESVRLIVSDTGMGMSPEILPRIFEPFFTTKPRGQGTGLGLAIVHGIVKNHDARIEVESEVGRGSTFTVTLPCVTPQEAVEAPVAAAPVPRGRGELILLAEDHDYVRAIASSALQSYGYQVVPAGDGAHLLENYASHRKDVRLFIVDVGLPRRGGLDCLKEIRARGDETPAIAVTGTAPIEIERELDEHTVMLRKPFQIPDLARLASSLIRSQPAGRRSKTAAAQPEKVS